MAYDSRQALAVLYGAVGSTEDPTMMWVWDGKHWTTRPGPAGLPPSTGAVLVFDQATGDLVRVPDASDGRTWLWNGTWRAVVPTCVAAPAQVPAAEQATMCPSQSGDFDAPSGLEGIAAAYDERNHNVVLMGDRAQLETWVWNGSRWDAKGTALMPAQRLNASMAFDPVSNTVVMFGGQDQPLKQFEDTWTWNGEKWAQQQPSVAPTARFSAAMAAAPHGSGVLLFGGTGPGGVILDDTWLWTGSGWKQLHPAHKPPARTAAGMAFDSKLSTDVLFGGQGSKAALGDTWLWDGKDWTAVSYEPSS